MRQWQRDLDRGVETELTLRIRREARAREAHAGVAIGVVSDMPQFVHAALAGQVASVDLPQRFEFAGFYEPRVDGVLTHAQHRVYQSLKGALERRLGRPLTSAQDHMLGVEFILEWNRRASLDREATERAS